MLLCDLARIGEYADGNILTVYMLRRGIADPTDSDALQVTSAVAVLRPTWAVGQYYHEPVTICEFLNCQRCQEALQELDPLVLAIQTRYQEDPDQDSELPNTHTWLSFVHAAMRHDFGVPEVSPLCEALRSGDDMAVSLLLQHRASPSMREEGSNDPIFVAIQMSSAENVHRLLQYSANPRSRDAIPSREGHAGRRRLRRRTALEAAASHPRCRLVLLDFMAGI